MRYVTKSQLLTHLHVDKLYTLQVYLGQWTRPDTYICSKRLSLRLWGGGGGGGGLEVRTWSGVGVNVLVCTRGAAFEMDSWWFGVFQLILQYNTQFSPRPHALHVLT